MPVSALPSSSSLTVSALTQAFVGEPNKTDAASSPSSSTAVASGGSLTANRALAQRAEWPGQAPMSSTEQRLQDSLQHNGYSFEAARTGINLTRVAINGSGEPAMPGRPTASTKATALLETLEQKTVDLQATNEHIEQLQNSTSLLGKLLSGQYKTTMRLFLLC